MPPSRMKSRLKFTHIRPGLENSYYAKNMKIPFRTVALAAALLLAPHLHAENDFYDYEHPDKDDTFSAEMPTQQEEVKVGGFLMKVDLTQYGIDSANKSTGNVLGVLNGKNDDLEILRVSHPSSSLDEEAQKTPELGGWPLRKVVHVRAQDGLHGVEAIYGGKPSLFTTNVHAIRYLFVNRKGETISFEARAKTADPDWSYLRFLMYKDLFLSLDHRNWFQRL